MPVWANAAFLQQRTDARSMASDDEEKYDGSELGDDPKGLKGDRGPKWDGGKTTYPAWWYEMLVYLCLLGLGPTTKGTNQTEQNDPDDGERTKYTKSNLFTLENLVSCYC